MSSCGLPFGHLMQALSWWQSMEISPRSLRWWPSAPQWWQRQQLASTRLSLHCLIQSMDFVKIRANNFANNAFHFQISWGTWQEVPMPGHPGTSPGQACCVEILEISFYQTAQCTSYLAPPLLYLLQDLWSLNSFWGTFTSKCNDFKMENIHWILNGGSFFGK